MRLLDLCCGAGGCSVGYWRAGFDVFGVDMVDQPFYPFEFRRADALTLDYDFLLSFDAIHASPPCQQYSSGSALARKRGKQYPDLFIPFRRMLIASGLPYIIENVQGSPAKGIGLCGTMFGLGVKRHRIFESNIPLILPEVPCTCSKRHGEFITVAGSMFAKDEGAAAMGIDWPIDKYQLKEAIPPAYTEFLGLQLLSHVSKHRPFFVSERPISTVSRNDNEKLPTIVSEDQVASVSIPEVRIVSVPERCCVPVTRRCGYCGEPLPQGTARRKYCNGNHRLKAFRSNLT